jgi:hypothetical protein
LSDVPAPTRRFFGSAIAGALWAIAFVSAGEAAPRNRAKASNVVKPVTVMAPLPPRRPAELSVPPAATTKPAAEPQKPAGPSICLATFIERGGIALPPAPDSGSGACAIDDPISFRTISMRDGEKVELDSAVTVTCAFAVEVAGWVRDDLPDIVGRDKAKVAKLVGVGGHACRPRNGAAGAQLSEHATGNALDLIGLRLQDGRTISLTGREPATKPLREALQTSACARFTTVLGPGSDSSHKDHLHLDMRKRPRDYKICQWTVE